VKQKKYLCPEAIYKNKELKYKSLEMGIRLSLAKLGCTEKKVGSMLGRSTS